MNVKGYESLADVLQRAFDQAANGKGAERHADQKPFDQQPMQRLCELYGPGFALGQAAKKSQEAMRLPTVERQVAELLGAINYLAGAIIHLEGKSASHAANDNKAAPIAHLSRFCELSSQDLETVMRHAEAALLLRRSADMTTAK